MLDDVDIEGDDGAEDEGGSWFSRASGGVRSLGSGALFLGALVLLFWNEGYSKRHGDALIQVAEQVQPASLTSIDPQLEGKPVHLSARVNSQAGASDGIFGIRTDGAVLYRHVEMFQWVEYEESTGRGRKKKTNYTYEQEWDSAYHDSSQFAEPQGHENPKPTLTSDGFFAADARFGPYRFDNEDIAQQALDELDDNVSPGSLGQWPKLIEQLPELPAALTAKRWYLHEPGVYYRGNQNSEEAELGDLAVSFYTFANDFPLTVVGAQQGERLVPWRASNGDTILLASGGVRSAAELVKQAQAEHGGLTHILRLVGLAGAVIGAAGIASWLGSFLSLIPVVGRLVEMSLMLAGGLFGLMAGLVTIVVGWLAARPWVAALLLVAIGSALTWAIHKRRAADGAAKRSERAGKLAAAARERTAAALQAATPAPPMALAGAGAAAMPPPPPGSAARFAATEPRPPMAPPPTRAVAPAAAAAVDESKELPPLEWTPGLIATKPPSVRPTSAPPTARGAEPVKETPPAAPSGRGGGQSETRRMAPVAQPTAAGSSADKSAPRAAAPALFDTVPPRESPAPLFDTVPMREASTPLFDTVRLRDRQVPSWEAVAASETAAPVAPAATAASAKTLRIALGSRGDYALNKLVRQHADGRQETLCFELTRAGKPIKRGTQDEVKEALRQALMAG